MIAFHKIRYKNFLSTGNAFTEIVLDEHPSTLIIGNNGNGKSTIVDALCFVLYGTAYRNINKPQLVNSITRKNMVVEVEFSIGSNQYMVRRGTEYDVFEIYQNNELINQLASAKEYQTLLETQILKMNKKSFCQVVILGTAGYIPFMQLSAYDRRDIIEDMLDIQIFSKMNNLLKAKITTNKDELKDIEHAIALLEQKIELVQKNEKMIQQNTNDLIQAQKDKITATYLAIEELYKDIEELNTNIEVNKHQVDLYDKVDDQLIKMIGMEREIHNKYKPIHKELSFFTEHDHCPVCTQTIDINFKNNKIKDNTKKLETLKTGIDIASKKNVELSAKKSELKKNVDQLNQWKFTIKDHEKQITTYQGWIKDHEKSIEKLEQTAPVIDAMELDTLNNKLSDVNKTKYNLLETKRMYDIAAVLLKDSGIKTKITKQYIPVINKLINKYLAALDFFVKFELNEQFKEKIKSRFRDEFSYASFSEGEKLRVDLALLFTWRTIAKMRNSASTNLLIMDEVFDSSLDVSGTEDFMKMLKDIVGDTNVFVISHKGSELFDKFQNVIRFEKVGNFSRIAA